MFLVDTKAWHGHIIPGPDGSAWHNGHPMDGALDTVRWEADQLAGNLGAPVLPLLCVHDARLPWGELYVAGAPIVPVLTPGRLVATLPTLPAHLDPVGSCCWPSTPAANSTPPPKPGIVSWCGRLEHSLGRETVVVQVDPGVGEDGRR